MKRQLLAGLVVAALAGWSAAQTTSPASDAGRGENIDALAAGTIIPVELAKGLDARKAKAGDAIECKLPADVLAHGKIVIPRETKIIGLVTEVKAHSKESPGSKVGITFERMIPKKGSEVTLQVIVQAVGRPLQLVDYAGGLDSGSRMPNAAGDRGAMSTSNPSRAQERVAAIPMNTGGSDQDSPPPTTMAPLGPTSKGVVGIKGWTLEASGLTSVISSETDNVHLDRGAQFILRVQ